MSVTLLKKILAKHSGFSLLELSVTMGLMGLVSLFTMKIMENQSTTQTSIEATAEINTTISLIAQTINDPAKCASMFYNRNVNSDLNGLSYTIAVPPATHQVLQTRASGKIYQNFFIQDASHIRLRGEAATGTANLSITFSVQPLAKSQKLNLFSQNNAKTIIRTIPFNVVTNAGGIITSCGPVISTYSQLAKQNACLSLAQLGGVWNSGTGRCEITQQSCPYGQIVRGFRADGVILCENAPTQMMVEDIFDLSHTVNCALGVGNHRWLLTTGPNGKLRIHCQL